MPYTATYQLAVLHRMSTAFRRQHKRWAQDSQVFTGSVVQWHEQELARGGVCSEPPRSPTAQKTQAAETVTGASRVPAVSCM